MKTIKFLINIAVSLLFATVFGVFLAISFNASPVICTAAMLLLNIAASLLPPAANTALAGVYREVWTGEVIKGLSHAEQGGFLDGIPDKSKYVSGNDEAQVVHMSYFGVKPDVLINNTTYPIPLQDLGTGADIPITLFKFTTKPTPITVDELQALSFDKIATVKDAHVEALNETKNDRAIHALAPTAHTAATPVLLTTGEDDGTGRKRLTRADIIALKKAFDDSKVPKKGRRLVLCPDHVADLLLLDQKFSDQYYNYESGKIANLYSFEVYEYVENPFFVPATKAKKSFGAVPDATDRMASVAFCASRCGKANGKTLMFYSKAENDPINQRNIVNFNHYNIVLPYANEAIGAIVSDNAA